MFLFSSLAVYRLFHIRTGNGVDGDSFHQQACFPVFLLFIRDCVTAVLGSNGLHSTGI